MKISLVPHPAKLSRYASGYNKRIYHLAEGLISQGHKVKVFTRSESDVPGKVVPIKRKQPAAEPLSLEEKKAFFREAIRQSRDADIINCQSDHMALPYTYGHPVPVIHTLITSALPDDAVGRLKQYRNGLFSAVSDEVADKFAFLNFVGVVYNGCDTGSFTFNEAPSDYFLTFCRIEPTKAVHKAVRCVYKAGLKMKIAGSIGDQEYFKQEIEPYLGGGIEYVGVYKPEDFVRKVKLIQEARAVFCLTESGEGFSNTLMEGLACGAPVIASSLPSFQKVIQNGCNGFITESEEEISQAISKVPNVDRWQCRQTILDNYTIEHMVDGYNKLFQKYAIQSTPAH